MKHPIAPPLAEAIEELGRQIAQLRYDAMLVVLRSYGTELERQLQRDYEKGRPQMIECGANAVFHLRNMQGVIQRMLRISARYMEEDIAAHPLLDPLE